MDKTVRIVVTRNSPADSVPAGVFRLRKYGDPFMVSAMGLNTGKYPGEPGTLGTTNFQNIDHFSPDPGAGFGAVSKWQTPVLSRISYQNWLDYLVSIQPKDAGDLRTKMSFLIGNKDEEGTPERPWWTQGGGPWGDEWKQYKLRPGEVLKFGTMSYGGQLIKVKVDGFGKPIPMTVWAKYQERGYYEPITFYEIEGLRWADRFSLTPATAPWYFQTATWAGWSNTYNDTWDSGKIISPVWDVSDFPCNYNTPLYISKDFLE